MITGDTYFEELKKRGRNSRVYKKYQLDGLEIAELLNDRAHKALYIKLVKEGNAEKLRELAASVATRQGVKSKGALFMYLLKNPQAQKFQSPLKKTSRKSKPPKKSSDHGT